MCCPSPCGNVSGFGGSGAFHFEIADRTVITRSVSQCSFEIARISGTSPVVLGGPRDAPLLGMVTLEKLSLMLNPLTRDLVPMKLMPPRAA